MVNSLARLNLLALVNHNQDNIHGIPGYCILHNMGYWWKKTYVEMIQFVYVRTLMINCRKCCCPYNTTAKSYLFKVCTPTCNS